MTQRDGLPPALFDALAQRKRALDHSGNDYGVDRVSGETHSKVDRRFSREACVTLLVATPATRNHMATAKTIVYGRITGKA